MSRLSNRSGSILEDLFEGKRIFKQEKNDTYYLVLPKDNIMNAYYFYNEVCIKKGDLLNPDKWLRFEGSTLLSKQAYADLECEYIFNPYFTTKALKALNEALGPDITIPEKDRELKSILSLKHLPPSSEGAFREAFKEASSDLDVVEAYYRSANDKKPIVLHPDLTDDDISYEYTDLFSGKQISSTYRREISGRTEYIIQIAPEDVDELTRFNSEVMWFQAFLDDSRDFYILKQLYDLEDMLPFLNFELVK